MLRAPASTLRPVAALAAVSSRCPSRRSRAVAAAARPGRAVSRRMPAAAPPRTIEAAASGGAG